MEQRRNVRVRDSQGRSEQPDRPRSRRAPPERAVAVDRHRLRARAGAAVLGVAALRAASPRLSARADAARARDRGRDQPPPAARDRNAARPAADREARDRAARDGAAWRRRRHRARARDAGQPPASRSWLRASDEEGSGVAEQAFNWRPTVERRVLVAAAVFALWTLGIEARLLYLQVYQPRDLVARAERQQMRTIDRARQARRDLRSPRPPARLQRRRRHHLRGSARDREPAQHRRRALRRARRLLAKERAALAERLPAIAPFTYVERRVDPARGAQGGRAQARRHRLHEGEPPLLSEQGAAARTCSAMSALDNVGLSGLEAAYDKVIRGQRRQAHRPDRRAAPRVRRGSSARRPAAARSSSPSTSSCSTSSSASCAPASKRSAPTAAAPSSWIRTPARSSRWPTGRRSTPTRSATSSEPRGATARCRTSTSRDRPSRS